VEIFDPDTDSFQVLGSGLKRARRGHTATLLDDGNVLVMGGGERSAEIVEPLSGVIRWANGYPTQDRKDHQAIRLPTGHVFFSGGSTLQGSIPFYHHTTEMYEPSSGAFLNWTDTMAVPRTRHQMTEIAPGRYLLTGGQNVDPAQPEIDVAEVYELD
jgi:hypothetical protein